MKAKLKVESLAEFHQYTKVVIFIYLFGFSSLRFFMRITETCVLFLQARNLREAVRNIRFRFVFISNGGLFSR